MFDSDYWSRGFSWEGFHSAITQSGDDGKILDERIGTQNFTGGLGLFEWLQKANPLPPVTGKLEKAVTVAEIGAAVIGPENPWEGYEDENEEDDNGPTQYENEEIATQQAVAQQQMQMLIMFVGLIVVIVLLK